MRVNELREFINTLVPGTYYSNNFPLNKNAPDKCCRVRLTGGFPPSQWTGKKQPSFNILVRGSVGEDEECEVRAYEIHNALTNLQNVKIGENSIVIIRAMNSTPLSIGVDENGRPIYTLNFDCVVRP